MRKAENMAAKVAILIAGLFVLALLQFAPGASQEIPDDKVYTELKKTLVSGSSGILTCRFTGPPFDVYWKKGHDGWDSPTVVRWTSLILRTLTPGAKTGPRYEDGSCDMNENYSLVIKTANYTDTGRYICFVSNQHGILIDNYTDVTVTDVGLETEPEISLEKGFDGILPCKLNVRPKVVTWKKGPTYSLAKILAEIDKYHNVDQISGPGYEEGLFNITADFSLVIVNVNIEDEGQYFCDLLEVDTDTIYQDFTIVSVFARPIQPFPAIEGCSTTEDHGNCILTVDSSLTLTCHANEYYPDVGLYFKHGPKEVAALHTQTWNNTDGTKNKSVTIVGDISHELYRCIAFEIPGVDSNISTSVRLIGRNGSPNLVALIVPFFLIAIGLLTWIFLRRRGIVRGMTKGDRSTYQEDPVAYVELWKLVEYASKHKECHFLGDVIAILCNDENKSSKATTNEENMFYYNGLCRWKGTCTKRKQRTTLYNTLYQNGLRKSLANLREFRGNVSTEICELDLKHILREIGEQDEITKFLVSLKIDPPERPREAETSLTIFHQQALSKLITWTRGNRDTNPVIILSSTLEKSNHESANNFFLIPDEEKQGLENSEYKHYSRNFLRNHVDMLAELIKSSTNTDIMVSKTIKENWETLFNIEKMLRDWWEEQECSNYKKRCILAAALRVVQHKPPEERTPTDMKWPSKDELKLIANYLDHKSIQLISESLGMSNLSESADEEKRFEALCAWRQSNKVEWTKLHGELVSALKDSNTLADEQWPSDDELKLIAHYLDQESTKPVSDRLDMSDLSESADEKERYEALCAWRQSNKEEWTKMHGELESAFKDTPISGLLSPLRNDAVHKVEVVDIAFNLLMTDILPVARGLGVCDAQLLSYRPVFEPSHLTKGTIGVVSTLVSLLDENNQRQELWHKLREGGFYSTIQRNMIVYEISYGELSAITNAAMGSGTGSEKNIEATQEGIQPNEEDPFLGTKEVVSPDTTQVSMEPEVVEAKESSQRFNIIKKMLNLTDEEVAAGSLATDPLDEFTLFKIWKEKPRPSVFNYRAAVIKCLHDFGKTNIARSVIAGKYKADEKNPSFIKHMVKKVITDGRLKSIAEALNLQKDFPGAQRSVDDISETICERLMIVKHAPRVCNKRVKERDGKSLQACQFDKLVDHGFLDLARELLIIDQQ